VSEKSRSSFTIGSQLQDRDCSHGRLHLLTQPHKGKTGTHHTLIKQSMSRMVVVGEEPKLKNIWSTFEEMLMLEEILTPSKPLKDSLIEDHVESWCMCTSKCHSLES